MEAPNETREANCFSKWLAAGGVDDQQCIRPQNPKIDSKDIRPIAYSKEAGDCSEGVSMVVMLLKRFLSRWFCGGVSAGVSV